MNLRRLATAIVLLAAPLVLASGAAVWWYRAAIERPSRTRGPTIPEPRASEADWVRRHDEFVARAMVGHVRVLFLGDSIMGGWLGTARTPQDGDGLVLWDRLYRPRRAANFGIGSDRIEHLLWRLRHGELAEVEPEVAVLQIGTNNLGVDPPEAIVEGVAAVIDEIHRRSPRTRVLLLGLFPRAAVIGPAQVPDGARPDPRIGDMNRRLAALGRRGRVTFLDIGDRFLAEDGRIYRSMMPDYLHLSRRGYELWAEAMEPTLSDLLGEPSPPASGP